MKWVANKRPLGVKEPPMGSSVLFGLAEDAGVDHWPFALVTGVNGVV